jgi:hypothetical protein
MYLNYFPGSVYESRDLWLSDYPVYAIDDFGGFLHSVSFGVTASVRTEGLTFELNNYVLLRNIIEDYGLDEECVEEIVEHINALILG